MSPTPQSRRFLGLRIDFDDRILEPRPWTEMQSRWAIELATDAPPGPILELCCGAGQIGLAAAVSSGRSLHQVDIDPVACGYARHNATVAGVDATVWCAELDADVLPESRYRIIIADPPYLDPDEALLYPNDPTLAVNGGPDGLELVRRCLTVIACRLDPDGTALLQLRGARQNPGGRSPHHQQRTAAASRR